MAQPTAPSPTPHAPTHPTARLLVHNIRCSSVLFFVECYCGEGELVDMTQVHLSFCNEACSGSSGACGGIGYVSVYDVPLSNNALISPNSVQGPNGQSDLLGCFSLTGSTADRANKALSTGALWLEEMDNEVGLDWNYTHFVLCVRLTSTKSIFHAT